jgi:hypothetical protein
MTSYVVFAIPGVVPPPPAVSMTTIDLLHDVGPDGAFLKCAGSVERSRIGLLYRQCKSKCASDEKRNLCAGHVIAPPFQQFISSKAVRLTLLVAVRQGHQGRCQQEARPLTARAGLLSARGLNPLAWEARRSAVVRAEPHSKGWQRLVYFSSLWGVFGEHKIAPISFLRKLRMKKKRKN